MIEDYDYNALPRLLASGVKREFAYIDGWHTFDYALLDWWYVDKMMTANGIVGFNDCDCPAVDKVIRFVLTHRKYTENRCRSPGQPGPQARVLRLLTFGRKESWYRRRGPVLAQEQAWEPKWNFFSPF